MTDNYVCPVCGKNGIPNYLKVDVECPCCGSDLSIYRVVDKIPCNKGKNVWLAGTIVASCVAIVLASILVFNKPQVVDKDSTVVTLRDSISLLNEQLLTVQVEDDKEDSGFLYVVRKGDSFWKISQRMYGTGTKASDIAEVNHRSLQDVLNVGDTLTIK